ncbi:MAG: hypothetical protein KC492_07015 [Myxococcales bacterium]|nr:hypothetical protein [Myxococcales bacterium]MCB9608274.1 hypothetical protein [Polyangiaceae bacterium]
MPSGSSLAETDEGIWEHAGFVVDARKCPLIIVTYPGSVDLEAYEVLFEEYARLAAAHQHLAWLIDFRSFNPITAPARVRYASADVFARYRERLLPSTLCEARVVESMLGRGVLTAFDWITGSKWPTENFKREDDAMRWIKSWQIRADIAEKRRD